MVMLIFRRFAAMSRMLAAMLLLAFALCTLGAQPVAAADTLQVGSDIGIPPGEFYAGTPRRAVGFDIDLMAAIAAKLQRNVTFVAHPFDTIISAVAQGKLDMGISLMTDTSAREKKVDFVDYLVVGSAMLVKSGNPLRIFNLPSLCGMRVPVVSYALHALGQYPQQRAIVETSNQCRRLGLARIRIVPTETYDAGEVAFEHGEAETFIGDYPIVEYLAKTLGRGAAFQVASRQFAVQPYGIVISKSNPALRNDVQRALAAVIADGTYDSLIKKWGLAQAALHSAPVNVGALYE